MLPKYYFDKTTLKFVPVPEKSTLNAEARKDKLKEDRKIKDQKYVKKILPFSDTLNRALHFQELNCFTQGDLNFYRCWNEWEMLKDKEFPFNQLGKIKTFLPRRLGKLTDETIIAISKHTIKELEYYTLNKSRNCYYHLEKIQQDHVKSMEDDFSEVEICKYDSNDIINHTSLKDDATLLCLDDCIFLYYGFRQDHITHGKPNIYRFIQMPYNDSSDSKYKFEIKSPRANEFRDAATSLNYVAVAFNNNLFIHNWLSDSSTSYSQYYNVDKTTKKRGRSQRSSDIMALCFIRSSMDELNRSDAILYVGFRNGTLIAIPFNNNKIDFDNRVMIPLPRELRSIVSLHECFDGGLIVSGLSSNNSGFQELLYIPKLDIGDLKTLQIIKLNTQYNNIIRDQEICCITKNKKFICYGKKGYKKDCLNVSQGGFDVFLLDSLSFKKNNSNSKNKIEIFPINEMSNYITNDPSYANRMLCSVFSIGNFEVSTGPSNDKNYYKGIQYETERVESDLSYGSRIAMIFNNPKSNDPTSETYEIISVELV